MFEANRDYNVRVASAYLIESAAKHTPGIELTLENDEAGSIVHTLWLTPKTVESVRKSLENMGVKEEQYSRASFLDNANDYLRGAECSIRTFSEEYNGKSRVKVQWINKPFLPSAGGADGLAKRAAAMLGGGKTEMTPAQSTARVADDENVPF